MSDENQPKSTDEEVTVEVASNKIESIDSLEELEAYAGEEVADEEGRTGVKDAYKSRKAELEAAAEESPDEDTAPDEADPDDEESPENEAKVKAEAEAQTEVAVVSVAKADIEALAAGVAERVKAEKELRPRGYDWDDVDKALFEASDNLEALAAEDGDTVDVPVPVLQEIVSAVALKVNRDRRLRGMMQPTASQKALLDAAEKAEDLDI